MIGKDTDSLNCGYDNSLLQAQSKPSEVHDAKQIPPAGFLRPSTLALINLHDVVLRNHKTTHSDKITFPTPVLYMNRDYISDLVLPPRSDHSKNLEKRS